MQAIRLVLDKKLEWYEKEISENWFSEGLGDWRGHIIIISLRFDELDSTKEEQAVLKYITGTSQRKDLLLGFVYLIQELENEFLLLMGKN